MLNSLSIPALASAWFECQQDARQFFRLKRPDLHFPVDEPVTIYAFLKTNVKEEVASRVIGIQGLSCRVEEDEIVETEMIAKA